MDKISLADIDFGGTATPVATQPKRNLLPLVFIGLALAVLGYFIYQNYNSNGDDVEPIVTPSIVKETLDKSLNDWYQKQSDVFNQLANDVDAKTITDKTGLIKVAKEYQKQANNLAFKPIDELSDTKINDPFAGNEVNIIYYLRQVSSAYKEKVK